MSDWTFIDQLNIADITYTFGIHRDGSLGIFSKSSDVLTEEIHLDTENRIYLRDDKIREDRKDDLVMIGKLKGIYEKGTRILTGAEHIPRLFSKISLVGTEYTQVVFTPCERHQDTFDNIMMSSPYFGPSHPYNTLMVRFFVIMVHRILGTRT